ncbi:hypothetical protein M2454_001005 [Aequitasia blattaphilus]|uniref:Uncharacterized protein n=1 Tax=Aequitasia blattaphilus TaxID=2949332 RepID=A0ABT1E992_9FIRM|nr:hypothetical protein [Aequitasia blattaphilus]MCP1102387.1 hypothetical protein [Aequitasia blattaphilus]MCR8615027.1 hypothetical protein [Aequitasia blattaphilus]
MRSDANDLDEFLKELIGYERQGVYIYMEDTPTSAFDVVEAHMVKEKGSYMREYILDESGKILELYFHYVGKCEHEV